MPRDFSKHMQRYSWSPWGLLTYNVQRPVTRAQHWKNHPNCDSTFSQPAMPKKLNHVEHKFGFLRKTKNHYNQPIHFFCRLNGKFGQAIFAEPLMISRVPQVPQPHRPCERSCPVVRPHGQHSRDPVIDGGLFSHRITWPHDIQDTPRLIPEPGGFLQCFNLVLGSPADLRFT